jgi:hypothetical protein
VIQFTSSSGRWCAVLGKESLSIGAGIVEYSQLGDSGDVVQYRSATLANAKDAALVSIRGRTSTNTPTAKDEAFALARAISARTYLIAHGVSPLKITLNYTSAADFIADNSTPAGRLQNQRVEIDIVHVPAF